MIFWRREPRFRKVVRPEQPLEKVYCDVLNHESPNPDSPCKLEMGEFPRLTGVWGIPHRESKLIRVGEERYSLIGGTFLLYPATLRPGACVDDRGTARIAYVCIYPDLIEPKDKDLWGYSLKGKYFRLRDDVEEVESYEDKFGHPVYVVRNRLGETFRLAGIYARLYHVLRERGGWVEGGDLLKGELDLFRRYAENLKEFVDRKSQEELEELTVEYGNTFFDVADRVLDLMTKLVRGEVEELPPPGVIPADLERMLAKIESQEFLFEEYTAYDLAEKRKDKFGGDVMKALSYIYDWFTALALGLLVYEALIVEMGIN
ncbi:MAG: hypothetical protein LM558_00655 [Thermosphaera sp.]|nr:hypothetical protein [Thermosphaera sp.]